MKNKLFNTILSVSIFTNLFCQIKTSTDGVIIGKQTWSQQNLTVKTFRNNDAILFAQSEEEWKRASDSKIPAYCYYSVQAQIEQLNRKKESILDTEKKFTTSQHFSYENDSLLNVLENQLISFKSNKVKSKSFASKIEETNKQIIQYKTEKELNFKEWEKTIHDESDKIKNELDEIDSEINDLIKVENELGKGSKYGYLYNFYAVNDQRGLAPEGWKVPSEDDWDELEKFIGNDAGIALKTNTGWFEKKGSKDFLGYGTNLFNFNGVPGGWRFQMNNKFVDINSFAYFWTSSAVPSSKAAYARGLDCIKKEIWKDSNSFNGGLSVRLIKTKEKVK